MGPSVLSAQPNGVPIVLPHSFDIYVALLEKILKGIRSLPLGEDTKSSFAKTSLPKEPFSAMQSPPLLDCTIELSTELADSNPVVGSSIIRWGHARSLELGVVSKKAFVEDLPILPHMGTIGGVPDGLLVDPLLGPVVSTSILRRVLKGCQRVPTEDET